MGAKQGVRCSILLLGAVCLALLVTSLIKGHLDLRSYDVSLRQLSDAPIVEDGVGMRQKHGLYDNYHKLVQKAERDHYRAIAMKKRPSLHVHVSVDVPVPLPWSLPEAPSSMKSSLEFMEELGDLKRRNNVPLPWEGINGTKELPTPIFVLNFPKSGTTTLEKYLSCGEISGAHTYTHYTYPGGEMVQTRIGNCLRNNFLADNATTSGGVAPLHQCDRRPKNPLLTKKGLSNETKEIVAFSDIGVTHPAICFYSSLHDGGLEHIARFYPNATLILMTRNTTEWFGSMKRWYGGRMLKYWTEQCKFGPSKDDEAYWSGFYTAHTEKIRRFASDHLSMTYIEVELNDETSSQLEQYTGISPDCFMKCAPGGKANSRACPAPAPSKKLPALTRKNSTAAFSANRTAIEELKRTHVLYNNYHKNRTMKLKAGVPGFLPWSLPEVPALMKTSMEFMDELSDIKRASNISLPWDVINDGTINLPAPVFVLNFPKTGTTTLQEYMDCGKINGTHTYTHYNYQELGMKHTRIGDCLRNNFLADKATSNGVAPLHQCEYRPYRNSTRRMFAFSDIGVPNPGICFYSSMHDGGLEHIARFYPNATLILMTRNTTEWYRSMSKWNKGKLIGQWVSKCKFGTDKGDESYWTSFYKAHTEKIRQFAQAHLSMTYIEVELNNATSSQLERYTGITSECFVNCAPQPGGMKPACPVPAPAEKNITIEAKEQ